MKSLLQAKLLFKDAANVRKHIERYNEKCSNSTVDKFCNKFVVGNGQRSNFVAQDLNIYLESYYGYYGSSYCTTLNLTVNRDKEVKEAFANWANKNMQLILDGIAEEMELMAAELKEQCQTELNEAISSYKDFFNEDLKCD